MQLTLNEEEIKDAIIAYVRSQINIANNQHIEVDMKVGRGDNGYSATLDICPNTAKTESKVVTHSISETPEDRKPVEEVKPETPKAGAKLSLTKPAPKEAPEETKVEEAQVSEEAASVTEPAEEPGKEAVSEEPPKKAGSIFNFKAG